MGKVIPMNGNGAEKRSTRGPSMNQVVLCGRLVSDPRVHVKADGLHVSEFRLVTNDRQAPEYHDVVTYRRLAELVGEYTRKAAWSWSRVICTRIAGRPRTAASGSGW